MTQKTVIALKNYFLITYFIALFIVADSISFSNLFEEDVLTFGFTVLTFLLYGLIYLIPAIICTCLASYLEHKFKSTSYWTILVAIVSGGLTLLFLYANAKIFSLYGMFFNEFILNLITTPGGIESLGGSAASEIGFIMIMIGFLGLESIIIWISYRLSQKKWLANIRFKWLLPITLLLTIIIHMGFALDSYTMNRFHLVTETIPFYQRVSARTFFKNLGFSTEHDTTLKLKGKLNYPLNPLVIKKPKLPYNIIWLTSESWRSDTLNEKVMPRTWEFTKNASRFTRNYSTGNGTRMGVFGMFTGLPGNYWFSFLESRRGAALIDVLRLQQYQMSLYTSAKFTYPEFDKTIFSQVPTIQLHDDNNAKTGWENDRNNVDRLLSFIDKRNRSKPFFTFLFFESPHARYYFPPESVIAEPYRDDINYATINKKKFKDDIAPIKNRYINSVHHLDMQLGRIFDYLRINNLLDNTIVILIGDHGEEFMEHGFWGHNSTFVDPQVRTPLVIYIPKTKPLVSDQMTSHMDVIPTLMPLLGVANPCSDYSIGHNLLNGERRSYTYISDWDKVTYVDDEVKITQPVNSKGFFMFKATKVNDEALSSVERKVMMHKKQLAMKQLANELGKFFKKK